MKARMFNQDVVRHIMDGTQINRKIILTFVRNVVLYV